MPRIALYHWLPVASNMLLRLDFSGGASIEENLRVHPKIENVTIDTSTHSLSYDTRFEFTENGSSVELPVAGNMNQRGFNQCVLDLPSHASTSTAGLLRSVLPAFSAFVVDLLYSVLPPAAQNNCAVLHEGIVGYDEFSSRPFDEATESPAKRYLSTYKFIVIMLGRDDHASVRTGFRIHIKETHHNPAKPDSINLEVPAFNPNAAPFDEEDGVVAHISSENNCVLFLSNHFSKSDVRFHHDIYKYAALIVFSVTISRSIGVLRNVRGHVPPLRRELAVALQHNTMLDEDFSPMVRISRYLSYVNLKLPVIQTVKNYLSLAEGSSEFSEKYKTFGPENVHTIPEVEAVQDAELHVALIIRQIHENLRRLENLFIEEKDEIQIFSDEISRHLQITLASQDIQLSTRELDAAEMSRELDRGGKNRANALKGLSIVLAANVGLQLVEILGVAALLDDFGVPTPLVKLAAFVLVPLIAWIWIDHTIKQKSSHMRLAMEVKKRVQLKGLNILLETKSSKRLEIEGSRRLQTWKQRFYTLSPAIRCPGSPAQPRRPFAFLGGNAQQEFDVTLDYEATGLVHAITLETEYDHLEVDQPYLVQQVVRMLNDAGCIDTSTEDDTSLLGQMLLDLGMQLCNDLPALNYIIAYRREALRDMVRDSTREGFVGFLTVEEKVASDDLIKDPRKYLEWINLLPQNNPELEKLLGKDNLHLKARMIEDYLMSLTI